MLFAFALSAPPYAYALFTLGSVLFSFEPSFWRPPIVCRSPSAPPRSYLRIGPSRFHSRLSIVLQVEFYPIAYGPILMLPCPPCQKHTNFCIRMQISIDMRTHIMIALNCVDKYMVAMTTARETDSKAGVNYGM